MAKCWRLITCVVEALFVVSVGDEEINKNGVGVKFVMVKLELR